MANQSQIKYQTYLLIESHPASLGKNLEVKLDVKHTGAQPLRKILEKTLNLTDEHQDYIITIYAGDIMSSLIKDKEIKIIDGVIRAFPVKISLINQKNKFDSYINPSVDKDFFIPFVKFEEMKKFFGKRIEPPPHKQLSPIDYIPLFSEAILKGLKKQTKDPIYLEFLRFSVDKLKKLEIIPCKLFFLVYEKILNTQDIDLLNSILEIFNINKIESTKKFEELNTFKEGFMLIYDNQENHINQIKKIHNVNFLSYLIKFYTVIIFYHNQFDDISTIENILTELRDKNPYDKLILPKMFLSEFNNFYRSLKINLEIKMSLMAGYIQVSLTYENLLSAFSMISEYIKGDLNTIIATINQNYEKINDICYKSQKSLKINDYIVQKKEDDLAKIQENLINLGQNKLNKGYKAITFNNNLWDIYFKDGKNEIFLEFLESHLIQISLNFDEIREALEYIIKYTKKSMADMMELFVKNYDKLEAICKKENKYINAQYYLSPNKNDDPDAIIKYLDYIIDRKIKSKFETINFKIDLWFFYINNNFNQDFQLYIEKKLFEGAFYYEDIMDCINYGISQRHKNFSLVLKLFIDNFEKINDFIQKKNEYLEITRYVEFKEAQDNLDEIYRLISELINLEKIKGYKTFNFPIQIWEPYSRRKDLDYLRLIRKIIIKLSEMDNTLNENDLQLIQKIHDTGLMYIKERKLSGNNLLEFLGYEEMFYNQAQFNFFTTMNLILKAEITKNLEEINLLKEQNENLVSRLEHCENKIDDLKKENTELINRIDECESDIKSNSRNIRDCESDIRNLKYNH